MSTTNATGCPNRWTQTSSPKRACTEARSARRMGTDTGTHGIRSTRGLRRFTSTRLETVNKGSTPPTKQGVTCPIAQMGEGRARAHLPRAFLARPSQDATGTRQSLGDERGEGGKVSMRVGESGDISVGGGGSHLFEMHHGRDPLLRGRPSYYLRAPMNFYTSVAPRPFGQASHDFSQLSPNGVPLAFQPRCARERPPALAFPVVS